VAPEKDSRPPQVPKGESDVRPVDSAADMSRAPDESLTDGSSEATDRRPVERRDVPRPPDTLDQRLDELPPGHPSSPYDADGGRRQPVPRLRDLEIADDYGDMSEPSADDDDHLGDFEKPDAELAPDLSTDNPPLEAQPIRDAELTADPVRPADKTRPLTDAEWTEHVAEVRDHLEKAFDVGLATDEQYTIDPRGEIWSEDRASIHDTIIGDLITRSANVSRDHKAIIAGGLGGAGKSTVLEQHAGIDRSQYLTINPDNIKEDMASRKLIPEVEGLTPMEASALVHEEASYIAKQLAQRARAEGINIIWDITMSSYEKTEQRIEELKASGYDRIDGLFVDIPVEVSVTRAESRHRIDHDKYRAGEGLGGRLVPPEVTRAQFDEQWGSQNRKSFEEVKHRFESWSRFDNGVDDRAPLLVETSMPQSFEHEETSR
jgi:predicted ABC-type ATPase